MKTSYNKGFTLVELLVVIAIIGVLSSVVVVSLNSARVKARDAKRLSDARNMATVLSIEATEGGTAAALTGCVTADASVATCTGPGEVSQFSNMKDPSTSGTACTVTSSGTCQYSITAAGAKVDNAKIRFYLEKAAGGLTAGLHTINANGVYDQ